MLRAPIDLTKSKKVVESRISYGYFSTRAPFGYRFADKELVLDPIESSIVISIFNSRLDNISIREIARDLGMNAMKVKRILENPAYVGKIRWQGKLHIATHEKIIDEKTFDTIRQRFKPKLDYESQFARTKDKSRLKRPLESYDYNINEELKQARIKLGYWHTKAPFGYFLRRKLLFPKPSQSIIVRSMFEDFSRGNSLAQLSRDYSLTITKATRILKNPIYTGKIRYKASIFDGKHTAIITPVLFEDVQQKLKARGSSKR